MNHCLGKQYTALSAWDTWKSGRGCWMAVPTSLAITWTSGQSIIRPIALTQFERTDQYPRGWKYIRNSGDKVRFDADKGSCLSPFARVNDQRLYSLSKIALGSFEHLCACLHKVNDRVTPRYLQLYLVTRWNKRTQLVSSIRLQSVSIAQCRRAWTLFDLQLLAWVIVEQTIAVRFNELHAGDLIETRANRL